MSGITRRRPFWIAYAILSLAALALAIRLFPLAIPIVNLDVTTSRAEPIAAARTLATKLALAPEAARVAARFSHDAVTQNYVELEGGGKRAFADLTKGDRYAPYWWEVRLFTLGSIDETVVRLKPDGAPYGFARRVPALSDFCCLTEYDARLKAPVAFGPEDLRNTLGEVLAAHGLSQLRIAETEKYAHVTFFMSGGREAKVAGEEHVLVPSPKVATYDLQPEMSLPQLTARLTDDIRARAHDVILCNIANPDMVGHSGILAAAIQAAEAVDAALGAIRAALESVGGEMIVTADHGNLEMMRDPETGQPHTSHTVGPVPFVYFGRKATLRDGGALRDIAPTMLSLLGLPAPAEMTGRPLVDLA